MILHNDLWRGHNEFRDNTLLLPPQKSQKHWDFFRMPLWWIRIEMTILCSVSLSFLRAMQTQWLTVIIVDASLNSAYFKYNVTSFKSKRKFSLVWCQSGNPNSIVTSYDKDFAFPCIWGGPAWLCSNCSVKEENIRLIPWTYRIHVI